MNEYSWVKGKIYWFGGSYLKKNIIRHNNKNARHELYHQNLSMKQYNLSHQTRQKHEEIW